MLKTDIRNYCGYKIQKCGGFLFRFAYYASERLQKLPVICLLSPDLARYP